MTYLSKVGIADGANLDAFARLRTSSPEFAFDAQFTYDLAPLLFEQKTAQSGASIAHDATNRCATMTFSSTPTGGQSYMQSYEWIRYQPGRSQAYFITFCFIETMANVVKFAGVGDGSNGIQFELNGTTKQFTLYSDTAHGDETVTQANWNIDPFDGSGPSGLTLDATKMQILVIDYQALYAGRVRVGFDIGGQVYVAHEFLHANVDVAPYIQNANLPIRCGMTCTGTVSTTMRFICSSAISEGGQTDVGGYQFSTEGTGTAGNGARAHIVSVRPKTTFNSIANRSKFVLDSVDVTVTGTNPVLWELVIGQAITGASYADTNATYSAMETSAGTISGSPAVVLASGYVAASTTVKSVTSARLSNRIPITLDAAGVVRALGTMSVLATGIGGTSATGIVLNWREIR